MHIIAKHRHVRLESLIYDWNRPNVGLSQTECYPLSKTYETERKTFPPRSPSDYPDIGGQSSESRFHRKGKIS